MEEKKKILYIILTIVILILISVNIRIFINKHLSKNKVSDNKTLNQQISTTNVVTDEEDNQNRDKKIASLNERLRMQTYFGTYISYIESNDYENAYNLLYDGFKQNYFPTLKEFEDYAKQKYPTNIVVEYADISREGTMYILTVKIKDALNSNKQTEVENSQIVLREDNVNDFKLSFNI